MSGPSNAFLQILKNILTGAQPSLPKRPSPFDYFLNTHYEDLVLPVVEKRWGELMQLQKVSGLASSDCPSVPPNALYDKIAIDIFDALTEDARAKIQAANDKEYNGAMNRYKNEMKALYNVSNSAQHRIQIEAVPEIMQPIISALETMTGLRIISWAGGPVHDSIGMMMIGTQFLDGKPEGLITFPSSQSDIFQRVTSDWMLDVLTKFIDSISEQHSSSSSDVYEQAMLGENCTTVTPARKRKGVAKSDSDNHAFKKARLSTVFASTSNPKSHSSRRVSRPQTHAEVQRNIHLSDLSEGSSSASSFKILADLVRQKNSKDCGTSLSTSRTGTDANPVFQHLAMDLQNIGESGMQQSSNADPTVGSSRSTSLPPIQTLYQIEPHRRSLASSAQSFDLLTPKIRQIQTVPSQAKISPSPTHPESNNSNKSSITDVAHIPDSAKWLLQGLRNVLNVDLGPAYKELLMQLIKLEFVYGFASSKKRISTANRPPEVGVWIRSGRGRSGNMTIPPTDVDDFARNWWAWWNALQPVWRDLDQDGKPNKALAAESQDWGCLLVPGANGLLTVVVSLYWWGCAVAKIEGPGSSDKIQDWNAAVEDCAWVLQHLISAAGLETPSTQDHRKGDGESSSHRGHSAIFTHRDDDNDFHYSSFDELMSDD